MRKIKVVTVREFTVQETPEDLLQMRGWSLKVVDSSGDVVCFARDIGNAADKLYDLYDRDVLDGTTTVSVEPEPVDLEAILREEG